ncbi:hypothetical protein HDU86_004799 [Geranomyces michiganensis]|nr:hypothetical protein HDU86_004799 [Geranomyces michiganensis]
MSLLTNILALVRRDDNNNANADNESAHLLASDSPPSFFIPNQPYEHYDSVKSEWIAVTALLFLWLASLLARQVAAMVDVRRRRAVEEEGGAESEPLLLHGGGGGGARSKAGEWAPRFDRAADALRVTLLMLLAATIFVSVPMPYTCRLEGPYHPGYPVPPETHCTVCLANGTTLGTSIISWVFTALSLLWLVMELAVTDEPSAAIVRSFVSLVTFPLILTIFVIGFKEWAKISARADQTCD